VSRRKRRLAKKFSRRTVRSLLPSTNRLFSRPILSSTMLSTTPEVRYLMIVVPF
jgi:hypothetical protein